MQYLQIVMDDGWFGGGIIMVIFIGIMIVCAYLMVCRYRMKAPAIPVCFKRIAYKVLKKRCCQNGIAQEKLDRVHTKSS